MANVETLSVVSKPTADEKAKQDAIDILGEALDRAKAGEVSAVLVIERTPDGSWSDDRSSCVDFPEAIGRLEIVKQAWIAHYLGK